MDLFGLLPVTARGNSNILVLIDHFTRWAEPIAMKETKATDIANVLQEVWMPKHGCPLTLLSDNGPQFVNEILLNFCNAVGIRKIYSTTYYPQRISVVKSYMRSLKKSLAALVREEKKYWDLLLPAVAFGYNTTPHTAIGHSPFFLVHGREAVLPVQRHLDEPKLKNESEKWLHRLWHARMEVYESHMEHEQKCGRYFERFKSFLANWYDGVCKIK